MTGRRRPTPEKTPDLELHVGNGTSARLVVVLPLVRDVRFHFTSGARAERIAGPWIDLDEAREQLQEIEEAQSAGRDIRLSWLVAQTPVAAAYIEEVEKKERGRW